MMTNEKDTVSIRFKNSIIKGVKRKSLIGKEYYCFLGIPYAKPPIGERRFMPPEVYDRYPEQIDGTNFKPCCIQYVHKVNIEGSEDCLYLNVYLPDITIDKNKLKPVLVYIHGGNFVYFGSNMSYKDSFMDFDIICVTLNYRLHVLGFANLGIPECSGNLGLKDQLLAIRWVKENINEFGGDPNNITISGTSSGASCCHILSLSPLAKGLFQKVILQSGCATSSWCINENASLEESAKIMFEFGRILGYRGEDKHRLIKYLKTLPASDLLAATYKLRGILIERNSTYMQKNPFFPSVEAIAEGAILPDSPYNLWKNVDSISFLAGVCVHEGGFFLKYNREGVAPFETLCTIRKIVKETSKFHLRIPEENITSFVNEVMEYYYSDPEYTVTDNYVKLLDFFSDVILRDMYCVYNFTRGVPNAKVYNYLFNYEGEKNLCKLTWSKSVPIKVPGAWHSDEMLYVSTYSTLNLPNTRRDFEMTLKLSEFFSNFMRYGDPNGLFDTQWKPSTPEKPGYLEINQPCTFIPKEINAERARFWRHLTKKYLIRPESTLNENSATNDLLNFIENTKTLLYSYF